LKLGNALHNGTALLKKSGIEDADDESKVLLCYVLNFTPAQLFANTDKILTPDESSALNVLVQRRLEGEPAAYIVQSREFYGIDIYVDPRVLIPRPETEILIEEAIKLAAKWVESDIGQILIVDVGTGSGAIAIALAKHIPNSYIFGVDTSAQAFEVAQFNVCRYGLQDRIKLIEGNLLQPLRHDVHIIVANLPYIADSEFYKLPDGVALYEPAIALKGGSRGTEIISELISQSREKLRTGGVILLEIGLDQEGEILSLINTAFPGAETSLIKDYSGINRVLRVSPRVLTNI